jgi:hypothetical protein
MEAFKRSISVETTTKSKKPRKAAAGQKEMLLPIGGKKGGQGECKENRQATTAVGMTTTTHDIYNNPPWTDMDIDDLKAAIENGRSVQDAAEFSPVGFDR